jgi:RNA polymerase sigma-70 factor (ECF subfamily)
LAEDRPSDGDLVRRSLAGDRGAFGDLVGRYERLVSVLAFQKVGNRADAEDVAQEAFFKAFAALGELKEPERFGSWLYGIVFRAGVDTLRRRARRGPPVAIEDVEPVSALRTEGEASRREEAEQVVAAVGALPDKYRLVLTLRYQEMLSYQEIAAHLGEPAGTIANRLHRAANLLRDRLKALAPAPERVEK